jgi:TIR domain
LGIISTDLLDAFISYAHDDNVLHDDAVHMFHRYLKPNLEAALRQRGSFKGDADIFLDVRGLPANGSLTVELEEAITRTTFLVIVIGKSYPRSEWCGQELAKFANRFPGARAAALERTFIIVLDRSAERASWGHFLEKPERPIFIRFYDEQTGTHIPPILEDLNGQAVPGPRFLRGVRKVAETMAERALAFANSRQVS